jgi:hypothetical protein
MEDQTEKQSPQGEKSQKKQESTPETNYSILTNPEQRKILKEKVKQLAIQAKDANMVIFLDKSTRPIAHFFEKIYPTLNPDTQLPEIRFINLGTEKLFPLVKWGQQHGVQPPMVAEKLLTPDSIGEIFGVENIDSLRKLLTTDKPSEPESKRIIVDDVMHTGRSMRIALKLASLLDNKNNYQGFFVLETDQEKAPFMRKELPFMPWGGITGVEDPVQQERDPFSQFGFENKRSFISARPRNQESIQKNRDLRKDLDFLAEEIKAEQSPSTQKLNLDKATL